jgi:hypothetical protein
MVRNLSFIQRKSNCKDFIVFAFAIKSIKPLLKGSLKNSVRTLKVQNVDKNLWTKLRYNEVH